MCVSHEYWELSPWGKIVLSSSIQCLSVSLMFVCSCTCWMGVTRRFVSPCESKCLYSSRLGPRPGWL